MLPAAALSAAGASTALLPALAERSAFAAAPRSCYSAFRERHCGGSKLRRVAPSSWRGVLLRALPALAESTLPAISSAFAALPPTSPGVQRLHDLATDVRSTAVVARCDSFLTVVGTPGRVDASALSRPYTRARCVRSIFSPLWAST